MKAKPFTNLSSLVKRKRKALYHRKEQGIIDYFDIWSTLFHPFIIIWLNGMIFKYVHIFHHWLDFPIEQLRESSQFLGLFGKELKLNGTVNIKSKSA